MVGSVLWHLHLELAVAESEVEDFLGAGMVGRWCNSFMFADLVPSSDAKVDSSFPDESWDISGRKEDKSDGEVFDEGNIESVVATEFDVGSGEEVKGGLLESSLCGMLQPLGEAR